MTEKILIISPFFFGYAHAIADELAARGHEVILEDERASNSTLAKGIFRIAPHIVKEFFGKKHIDEKISGALEAGITRCLLFSVEIVSPDQVKRMTERDIIVSRYSWDSVSNRPGIEGLDPHVRRIGSFDPLDCERYGYDYIPLFSQKTPQDISTDRPIDFSYCGSFHSIRPYWFGKIFNAVKENGWSTQFMLYYQSRWAWLLKTILKPHHWHKVGWFSTTPFAKEDVNASMQNSKIVIDIHHPKQAGLTMRTFETLANGAVLLTTNPTAKSNLPPPLLSRIAILDAKDVAASMAAALKLSPGAVSKDLQYFLSIARFGDQIEELLGLKDPTSLET